MERLRRRELGPREACLRHSRDTGCMVLMHHRLDNTGLTYGGVAIYVIYTEEWFYIRRSGVGRPRDLRLEHSVFRVEGPCTLNLQKASALGPVVVLGGAAIFNARVPL